MRLWEWMLDLLFPPKCPFCQRILEYPRDPVCPYCQETLPWLRGEAMERKVEFMAGCYSPLAYRGAVPDSIHRYKFPGNPSYARPYGTLMAQCMRDWGGELPGLITWVPLSKKRKRIRGFDQAEALAREVARQLGIPAAATLRKEVDTKVQSHLRDRSSRRANVLGAYALRANTELEGLRILLVDDVVTSGSTLSECANVLLAGGAKEVLGITLAQARKE